MVYSYPGKLVKGCVMKWIMIDGRWRAEPTGRQATGTKWWRILLSFGGLHFIPIHLVSSLGKCFTDSSLLNTLLRWSTRYSQRYAFIHAHLPFGFMCCFICALADRGFTGDRGKTGGMFGWQQCAAPTVGSFY